MNLITNAMIVPHPPIIVPNIGKGEERKIQNITDAYKDAAKRLIDSRPDYGRDHFPACTLLF